MKWLKNMDGLAQCFDSIGLNPAMKLYIID